MNTIALLMLIAIFILCVVLFAQVKMSYVLWHAQKVNHKVVGIHNEALLTLCEKVKDIEKQQATPKRAKAVSA